MDMIVAAGGGERDVAVDMAILNADAKGNSAPGFLNERLMNDLRPTLFLAQLSNLLAGNIALVHGVTGSSRTLMGCEGAGGENSGFAPGSGGAFLVIESRAHAEARGAKPYARLTNVVADMARRKHS